MSTFWLSLLIRCLRFGDDPLLFCIYSALQTTTWNSPEAFVTFRI